MESMGMHVGKRLAERYTCYVPRINAQLDMIKFICKEFWTEVFRKQADKLQTNYQGIYVLHDYNLPWFSKLSHTNIELQEAQALASLACGIVKGALLNLGMKAKVTCEIVNIPRCQFTVVDATILPGVGGDNASATSTTTK
eukprot:CAMPEP_0167743964 /NCGR_PEP_ID=MMETSP0110_2-20121227/2311_1 /TAXON_ID=629695 /ORGANISM="Gymnochlora sp., Strain CCMP2014" /LENGTH=140 /DNA_ID=CAMNT_0007628399 /DNA_START=150 /DNA_END=572 /DNA_ORIENTATION=+